MPKPLGVNLQMPGMSATPPGNPPTDTYLLYMKTDGKLYTKNSAGVETPVDSGGGGGGDATPSGATFMWPGASAPTGYYLAQGQALDTTTDAALFAVMGYAYGGSGSTFNLPDLRVRVPVGAGTGKTLGTSDGVAEASRNANRTHSHGHGNTFSVSGGSFSGTSGAGSTHTHTFTGSGAHTHTHTIGTNTGGSTTAASGTAVTLPTKSYVDGHTHGGSTGSPSISLPVGGTNSNESSHTHSISGSVGVSLSGAVSSNTTPESPYVVFNYIIKR